MMIADQTALDRERARAEYWKRRARFYEAVVDQAERIVMVSEKGHHRRGAAGEALCLLGGASGYFLGGPCDTDKAITDLGWKLADVSEPEL